MNVILKKKTHNCLKSKMCSMYVFWKKAGEKSKIKQVTH